MTAGTKGEAWSKRRLQIPASTAAALVSRDLEVAFRRAAGNDDRDTASFHRSFLASRKSSKGALGEGTGKRRSGERDLGCGEVGEQNLLGVRAREGRACRVR